MKHSLAILISLSSLASHASDVSSVHVARSNDQQINQEVVLPFGSIKSFTHREVWRSSGGIVCTASAYEQKGGSPKGVFECESEEGYRAQIEFDCTKNINKETSAYLFFGLLNMKENTGNFYVWCS